MRLETHKIFSLKNKVVICMKKQQGRGCRTKKEWQYWVDPEAMATSRMLWYVSSVAIAVFL